MSRRVPMTVEEWAKWMGEDDSLAMIHGWSREDFLWAARNKWGKELGEATEERMWQLFCAARDNRPFTTNSEGKP